MGHLDPHEDYCMKRTVEQPLTDKEHIRIATEMYERWQNGEKKSFLEAEYWNNTTAHSKAFTSYVTKWLGHKTEKQSKQSARIVELEAHLRVNGISPTKASDLPEEYRLLAKSRESAFAALRVYNDPQAKFRTETFIILMVVAWNSLLQAILEHSGIDYHERDKKGAQRLLGDHAKVLSTRELFKKALNEDKYHSVFANLDFFLGLRNKIVHRYLPDLDSMVVGEAQAMLLNFEKLLTTKFGEEAALGDRLAVPLQLSGFRQTDRMNSLRKAQAQLPTDVAQYLARHRFELEEDVLKNPDYCLQIFFVPVAANRERSADAVVRFVPLDKVTPELEAELTKTTVVTKRKSTPVASDDLLRPGEVVSLVSERLPYRFTMNAHTQCWKHYNVRPQTEASDPTATDSEYCQWDRLMRGYGYTCAWVDKLVCDLSESDKYETVIGHVPDRR